jgi:phosphoribosylformylglycinamidine synthase II
MSEQPIQSGSFPIFCIRVSSSLSTRSEAILAQLPSIGIDQKVQLKILDLYFVEGDLDTKSLQEVLTLICDPVTQRYEWRNIHGGVGSFTTESEEISGVIEVMLRPGVTDNVANQLLNAAHRLGIRELRSVAVGQRYEFSCCGLSETDFNKIAQSLLVNATIQRYSLSELQPQFIHPTLEAAVPEILQLRSLTSEELLRLSETRRLALNLEEMLAIRDYFGTEGRDPTDAELETLAQTWSEHCVHKTFKARIEIREANESDKLMVIDGLLSTYLRAATDIINAPWVLSAFVDNAGVIEFDDEYDLSFKVETHNHPSAIEPFGGANTGVGGVVRDILGVSHRPIANTDVLCFGTLEQTHEDLPVGVLHPSRIRSGVVEGIEDYGNKLGLPTVNGAVIYHPGYTSNPLVYCGCLGLGPHGVYPHHPQPGDHVIVIGGRTGRDGLRGATFSSQAMDAQTGVVAGSSVQIGDPITEKGVMEVVVRARDAQLYHSITDCGAGGLSSAVGEMSADLGVQVDLRHVPLKYAGLSPWEIWLSEAQERMVMAVPEENIPTLASLCAMFWVEWSDIGVFQPTNRLQVFFAGTPVVDLENHFLHKGLPRLNLQAILPLSQTETGESNQGIRYSSSSGMPPAYKLDSQSQHAHLLLSLLSHPNIASKETIIRLFDHEVRGATLVKPLTGVCNDGPSDAVVLKPLETHGWRGIVLANGINPFLGEADPYAMSVSAVDEAVRNAVCVGADPAKIALLDNFCWGDPSRPGTLGGLVRAAQGCYDAALHYRTPFISGKDSLNNEYLGADGRRHAIPGTLLISSLSILPDARRAVTMDLKAAGDMIYLVGDWQPALAGSHALMLALPGYFEDNPAVKHAPVLSECAPEIYKAVHLAITAGLVAAAHDLSEGGLAVAAVEMALAGRLGLSLELGRLYPDPRLALFAETNGCLLVEVAPKHILEFEAKFHALAKNQSLPVLRLGMVTKEPDFVCTVEEEMILHLPVSELVSAFHLLN